MFVFSFRALDISDNDIQNIDPNIKIPTGIRNLYLENNKLNDDDVKIISKSDAKLYSLRLNYNQITFKGFVDIINNQNR